MVHHIFFAYFLMTACVCVCETEKWGHACVGVCLSVPPEYSISLWNFLTMF